MIKFERACRDTEGAAEATRKSAQSVVLQAGRLVKAARTGNVAGIRRYQKNLKEALFNLQQEVSYTDSCWTFSDEEERDLLSEQYIDALKTAAAEKGLNLYERDGDLISHPSIVRILPAECAVRIDRKKVSTVRLSHLVDLLLENQKKSSGFSSQRFLESLYTVYVDISDQMTGNLLENNGRVIPLARIYKLMTSLPGSAREYGRGDFARDLYVLDSDGPRQTRSGASVSFPSSTGARRRSRDLFSFIGPNGESAEYYGIRFVGSEQ